MVLVVYALALFFLSLLRFEWSLLRHPDRLLAGGAIRIIIVRVVFASARPVATEMVVLFSAFRRADGQWPPLRVRL